MKAYPLSKAEEKKLLAKIIADCPDGYVADILTDCHLDMIRAIDSDFGFIPFAQYMAQVIEQQAELKKTALQLSELKEQVRTMESRKFAIEQELDKVRQVAVKLQWLGAL